MIRLFLLIIFSTIWSCNANKTTEKEEVIVNSNSGEAKNIFTISFISIGAGIDINARSAFNQLISSFEKTNGIKLTYEMINWGKEGEADYCFDLKPLKQSIQEKFIAESKASLMSSTLIRYPENEACREARK